MRPIAAIVGLPGPTLTDTTRTLLRTHPPAGVILFGRNVQTPAQLRALTDDLRTVLPPEAVLMVDQEGGRVARLRPPHWRAHPPAGHIGAVYATDPAAGLRAAWLTGALIGQDCASMGFDIACAPVLDCRLDGMSDVIGDRGFAADPETIASLGRAMADGLLAAGIQPVMKHLPGHGRARTDSHLALPVVDDISDADLLPFRRLSDLGWAMTAHILYPAHDAHHPATLSASIIQTVIRGTIGFGGMLCSDDLAMHALEGTPAERALAALAAGCDVAMYCPGDHDGTRSVLEACPVLTDTAMLRLSRARMLAQTRAIALDADRLAAERTALLS